MFKHLKCGCKPCTQLYDKKNYIVLKSQLLLLVEMSKSVPSYAIYKSKRSSKHPGILTIEGNKFYCKKRTKKDENGTQGFAYICSEWDGGYRASATLTTIQVTGYLFILCQLHLCLNEFFGFYLKILFC